MKRVVPTVFTAAILLALSMPAQLFARQDGRGRKYVAPPATAKITVTVLRATNGKPLENAAVVFHPMKGGKDEGGLELKTNEDGKAVIEVIPIGYTVRLQIIANGYQTFGDDYQITTATRDIEIRMKHPPRQYSIYEKHSDAQVGGTQAQPAAPAQKPD